MTLHVLVVGNSGTEWMRGVLSSFDATIPGRIKVEVPSAAAFAGKLAEAVGDTPIDVLDILDHGNPGVQFLGRNQNERSILFGTGPDMTTPLDLPPRFDELKKLLSRFAIVRLLGCDVGGTPNTAVGLNIAGRALALKLAAALGEQRQVLLTLAAIRPTFFDENGFKDGPMFESMFSANAALDGPAPPNRSDNLRTLKVLGFHL